MLHELFLLITAFVPSVLNFCSYNRKLWQHPCLFKGMPCKSFTQKCSKSTGKERKPLLYSPEIVMEQQELYGMLWASPVVMHARFDYTYYSSREIETMDPFC